MIDHYLKSWISPIVGIVALSSVSFLQKPLDRVTQHEPSAELLYLPDKQVIHALALGDDAAGADILWLRGVFYIAANSVEEKQETYYANLSSKVTPATVGNTPESFLAGDFRNDPRLKSIFFWNLNSSDAPRLFNLAERVTDLSPNFVTPYIYSSTNLALFYGRYEEARRILDKGVKNCPGSWEPLYHRGFLRLFYENDKAGAAEDIRRAAAFPGVPTIIIQLSAAIDVGAGNRETALEFLRSLREITTDDILRSKIDNMIDVYGRGITTGRTVKKDRVGGLLDSLLNEVSAK